MADLYSSLPNAQTLILNGAIFPGIITAASFNKTFSYTFVRPRGVLAARNNQIQSVPVATKVPVVQANNNNKKSKATPYAGVLWTGIPDKGKALTYTLLLSTDEQVRKFNGEFLPAIFVVADDKNASIVIDNSYARFFGIKEVFIDEISAGSPSPAGFEFTLSLFAKLEPKLLEQTVQLQLGNRPPKKKPTSNFRSPRNGSLKIDNGPNYTPAPGESFTPGPGNNYIPNYSQ